MLIIIFKKMKLSGKITDFGFRQILICDDIGLGKDKLNKLFLMKKKRLLNGLGKVKLN